MQKYNHDHDKKWQDAWEKAGIFNAEDSSDKEKFYCLVEFPFPSGSGLHVGHVRSYTALDIVARKRRMEGYNVLYPIGWDAFGLPAENYAIKTGRKPKDITKENTDTYRRQLKSMGLSFDWAREVNTTDPEYYKWTQWMFLEFFDAGLAYKKKLAINWCVSCKIGLANEEVVNGACERCGGEVEKRDKEQWMIAITKYADRLIEDLEGLDYLEKIKKQQVDWIGRSEGASITFKVDASKEKIEVFTTRPDTLFGATYMVLAPEHDLVNKITSDEQRDAVAKYVKAASKKTDIERGDADKAKTGVATGAFAINPATGEKIPVWVADYVLMGYGTGAIMAVPAHDERDYMFAKEFGLKIEKVIAPDGDVGGVGVLLQANSGSFMFQKRDGNTDRDPNMVTAFGGGIESGETALDAAVREVKEETGLEISASDLNAIVDLASKNTEGQKIRMYIARGFEAKDVTVSEGVGMTEMSIDEALQSDDVTEFTKEALSSLDSAYTGDGKLVNSDFLNGLDVDSAKQKMILWLEDEKIGEGKTNYRLRDWVFSRQRYWGEPIPLVNCEKCGWVPVPENQLPVELPDVEKYEPTDSGESPLAAITDWVNTSCPRCEGPATRETDTMPNWAGSSWYFLRYIDPHNDNFFADSDKLAEWMPVDWYNGGMEHTTLHLLYSRFWNKFLADRGHVPATEPYAKRTSHGLILAEDGSKMSKSKGNVVNPDDIVVKFGADTLRVYELFIGPFGEPAPWSENGLLGVKRFLDKSARLSEMIVDAESELVTKSLHKMVKKVGEDIEAMRFNTAVSAMMIFVNDATGEEGITKESFEIYLKVLNTFAPHLCEELWQSLGYKSFVAAEIWPEYTPALAKDDVVTIGVQVNGKVRGEIKIAVDASEDDARKMAMADSNVEKHLEGKEIKKFVYVPGRIISIVV
jgi:leucyl-tRNA synthetase